MHGAPGPPSPPEHTLYPGLSCHESLTGLLRVGTVPPEATQRFLWRIKPEILLSRQPRWVLKRLPCVACQGSFLETLKYL